MKWIPNALSLSRLMLAPVIAYLTYLGMTDTTAASDGVLKLAFGLFVVSALTDWADGYLARVLDAKSALGGKLDLWGDKVLVGCNLVALWLGWLNWGGKEGLVQAVTSNPLGVLLGLILLAAIPGRDSLVTRLRARKALEGITLSPTFFAKSKTAVIMAAMGVILAGLALPHTLILQAGVVGLWIGAWMSVWSGYRYFRPKAG